jgi:putative FmdB family regulatory protein
MPIYEYACKACGFEKEVLQKISDAALTSCPSCHEASFVKRISAAGFRLSGTGWYETDFKTGNRKNLAGDSPGGKPDRGAGDASKKNDTSTAA